MRPVRVTVSSATTSATIPVNWRAGTFNIGIEIEVTGTNTSKLQYTLDDVQDPTITPVWIDHATLTGLGASTAGALTTPCKAVRLNVTAYTNGSVTMQVVQAG